MIFLSSLLLCVCKHERSCSCFLFGTLSAPLMDEFVVMTGLGRFLYVSFVLLLLLFFFLFFFFFFFVFTEGGCAFSLRIGKQGSTKAPAIDYHQVNRLFFVNPFIFASPFDVAHVRHCALSFEKNDCKVIPLRCADFFFFFPDNDLRCARFLGAVIEV